MQTILVCDDDKEIVEAIQIYLEQVTIIQSRITIWSRRGMRYSRLMTGCRHCSRSVRIRLICW